MRSSSRTLSDNRNHAAVHRRKLLWEDVSAVDADWLCLGASRSTGPRIGRQHGVHALANGRPPYGPPGQLLLR